MDKLEPISSTDAKNHFGELLHECAVNDKKYKVNRRGKPMVVVLSYSEYLEMKQKLDEEE